MTKLHKQFYFARLNISAEIIFFNGFLAIVTGPLSITIVLLSIILIAIHQ